MGILHDLFVVFYVVLCVAGLIFGSRGAYRIATYRKMRKAGDGEHEKLGKKYLIVGDFEFVVGFAAFAAGIYLIASHMHL